MSLNSVKLYSRTAVINYELFRISVLFMNALRLLLILVTKRE